MTQRYGKPWGPPKHLSGGQLFEFFPNVDDYTGFEGPQEWIKRAETWFTKSDMGKWLRRRKHGYRVLTNQDDDFFVLVEDANVAMQFKLTFC